MVLVPLSVVKYIVYLFTAVATGQTTSGSWMHRTCSAEEVVPAPSFNEVETLIYLSMPSSPKCF
jgi:hypothetical protein